METTGLTKRDRIVSLGVLRIESEKELKKPLPETRSAHLIFNPGVPSHPMARRVHGYDDAILAMQQPLGELAGEIGRMFEDNPRIVAHNASFDERFLRTELPGVGCPLPDAKFDCTMRLYRKQYEGSAALKAILPKLGVKRQGKTHGALEDAFLCMQVYCFLNKYPLKDAASFALPAPTNFRKHGPDTEVLVPPGVTINGLSSRLKVHLADECAPIATLMMAIAFADGEVTTEEVSAIGQLIEDVAAHEGLSPNPFDIAEVLEDLVGDAVEQKDIESACKEIKSVPYMRASVGNWLKLVAYADGSASAAEAEVIQLIASRLTS